MYLRNGESGDGLIHLRGTRVLYGVAALTPVLKLWDTLTGDELHSFEHKYLSVLVPFQNRLNAPPREVEESPGLVRRVAWLHNDQTTLSLCTDWWCKVSYLRVL
ncbi:unnamed protein product [Thlaspi arvense]|uniref:Uncharacterized protein n=1 Tax=Thlaspi arvense TaxID=13288 RepID=A0AAU9RGI3_THLAR|nr:unnamed protein product [Thlaspi arvense]